MTTTTSDERDLLSAILAHPDEDTPRLMLADALEERGQPARAEFIRVQVELAQLDRCEDRCRERIDFCCETCLRESILRKRELEILDTKNRMVGGWRITNYVSWATGGDIVFAVAMSPQMRRGFADSLRCSTDDFLHHGPTILAAHPVTTITLPEFRVEIKRLVPQGGWDWRIECHVPTIAGSDTFISQVTGTRDDMIERLMQDVRTLRGEFA